MSCRLREKDERLERSWSNEHKPGTTGVVMAGPGQHDPSNDRAAERITGLFPREAAEEGAWASTSETASDSLLEGGGRKPRWRRPHARDAPRTAAGTSRRTVSLLCRWGDDGPVR